MTWQHQDQTAQPQQTMASIEPDTIANIAPEEDDSSPIIIVGVSKSRTKKSNDQTKNARRFSDFGEFGFYQGELNPTGERHGQGKISYDSGNYYEGPFYNNKFQGKHGIYGCFDGDEQEGSWLEGGRHGISIFRSAVDGSVAYADYVNGKACGEGVWWRADRMTARMLVDGKKKDEISFEMAEQLAKEKFELPVPEPSKNVLSQPATVPTSSKKSVGLLGRLFRKDR